MRLAFESHLAANPHEYWIFACLLSLSPITCVQEVVWESDNPDAATVDAVTGKVTAVGKGRAVITAKAGIATARCQVNVTDEVAIGTMWGVVSPDGNVQMTKEYGLAYTAVEDGKIFIEDGSVLGLKNSVIDTSKGLTFVFAETEVTEQYFYSVIVRSYERDKNLSTYFSS